MPLSAARRAAALERHFAVDDADAAAAKAAELGGTVLVPPMDAALRPVTVLSDPQGAVFTASKYVPPGSE